MAQQSAETHSTLWRGIAITVTFTPERFGLADHIEIETQNRRKLPVTETGYRSHFMEAGTVAAHGGALAFATAWLDHEAQRTGWRDAPQQLNLFD